MRKPRRPRSGCLTLLQSLGEFMLLQKKPYPDLLAFEVVWSEPEGLADGFLCSCVKNRVGGLAPALGQRQRQGVVGLITLRVLLDDFLRPCDLSLRARALRCLRLGVRHRREENCGHYCQPNLFLHDRPPREKGDSWPRDWPTATSVVPC